MPKVSTVGTFVFAGAVYAVESHPGEIRVTDASGSDAVVVPNGLPVRSGGVRGRLWECATAVLEAAAAQGRGPWARRALASHR
jgi:hypothetical protein